MLRTPEGVDCAFAKRDAIKYHLIFGPEGSQAPEHLADKEVAFSTGCDGRMFAAAEVEGQPFQIIWDGWVVPAGGRNVDTVMEYLYFATDSQRLADQAKFISYGPARASSAGLVSTRAERARSSSRVLHRQRRRAARALRQLDAGLAAEAATGPGPRVRWPTSQQLRERGAWPRQRSVRLTR